MSAEYQNGMRNTYGFPELPDPNEDLEGTVQRTPQVAHVAGGSYPTEGPGGLPVSAPKQTNGENFIQTPGPLGQAANAPPPPVAHEVSDPYPPSQQHNQPAPSAPARPELKTPSTADYIFQALAGALHGRASGALFGALAAPGMHRQDQQALKEKQYEFDIQDQERKQAQAFRMQPKPLTEDQRKTADFENLSNSKRQIDPKISPDSRYADDYSRLTRPEFDAGNAANAENLKTQARIAATPPTPPKEPSVTSRSVHTTTSGETVTYDSKGNTWLDSRGRPMASAPKLGSIAGGGAAGNAESDIHITAQALVDANRGDPTAVSTLKQLGGFGNKKMQIFAEARRIDPTFNASKGDRMAKTVENFTTATVPGSGNMQLRSIGTFAQHAVGVQEAIKEIGRSDNQILNRPISWIQEQSDPKYTAFQAALLAPTIEYLRLLNNGGSPYKEEREEGLKILSKYSTVGQAVGATREMGKVVFARGNSLNAEFKRGTGGHDLWKTIPDALPPEAYAAMAQLGHPISGGQTPQSGGQAPQPGQGVAPGAGVAAAGQQPKFSKMSTSGKFGWDGAKWVPVSQ